MAQGRDSWSFSERDFNSLADTMQRFLSESGCRCVLLADRSGQLINTTGSKPDLDPMALASLAAADFSANDQLARLIGETDFSSLFHQGERESMYLAGVAGRLILVAIFDNSTTIGMVRLRTRQAVEELTRICESMFAERSPDAPPVSGILAGADDEIDRLFR